MTATIVPPDGVPGLVRTDPAARVREYVEALRFYVGLPPNVVGRVVFAENSGADLAPLRDVAAEAGATGRVRFVSWPGLDHSPRYGRGYGEFKLIDHVLFDAGLFDGDHAIPATAPVWKVTGRYHVLNLPQLVRTAPVDYELYCDLKDRPGPWVDLRVFSFTLSGYDRLLRGAYHGLREDVNRKSPEEVLRATLHTRLRTHRIVPRLRVEPRVEGSRGKDGRPYTDALGRAKFRLRSVARRVTPWLWV